MFAASTNTSSRGGRPSKSPQPAVRSLNGNLETLDSSLPIIALSYDNNNSEESAKELVYNIEPEWRAVSHELEFTKFTDGITNTLLKITRRRPGATQKEIDDNSVLMRAYGNNTDLIIDRDREAQSHALLAARGMAPPLLARFSNGLLYKYIPGKVCTPEDFTKEQVWRGIAKKLAEWHARVPISAVSSTVADLSNGQPDQVNGSVNGSSNGLNGVSQPNGRVQRMLEGRSPAPNLWSVLQKWVDTLSTDTEKERTRKKVLQHEIERSFQELDSQNGIGEHGLVFGHLDLLSANVIILPSQPDATSTVSDSLPVTFIDYEYATPCPVAYDIANHFGEWAGYDLDYSRMPIKPVRRAFLSEYLAAYNRYSSVKISDSVIDSLEADIDRWRGMPGLFWGIWGLIQAKISDIDFDYAQYAEDRLDEYWAWRAEASGTRAADDKPMPLRERRWAQEA